MVFRLIFFLIEAETINIKIEGITKKYPKANNKASPNFFRGIHLKQLKIGKFLRCLIQQCKDSLSLYSLIQMHTITYSHPNTMK